MQEELDGLLIMRIVEYIGLDSEFSHYQRTYKKYEADHDSESPNSRAVNQRAYRLRNQYDEEELNVNVRRSTRIKYSKNLFFTRK